MASIIAANELTDASGLVVRSSVRDDVWHPEARDTGGYEWWYFDAVSDDGRDVLVVIFLADFVFSPRYNRAVSGHLRRMRASASANASRTPGELTASNLHSHVAQRPAQVPAIALCLYRDGRPHVRAIHEYAAQDFDARTDRPACRIARNHFRLEDDATDAPHATRYTITLDETLRRDTRLAATLHWTMLEGDFSNQHSSRRTSDVQTPASPLHAAPSSSATQTAAASHYASEESTRFGGKSAEFSAHAHEWNMVAPRCRVTGEFSFTGRDGHARVQEFRGTGYHDHNRDRRWMPAAIAEWQWGRAHFSDVTAVFYRYREHGDTSHTTRLFLVRHGEVTACTPHFAADAFTRHIFGLRYPRHLRFHTDDDNTNLSLDVRQRRIIDGSYFYLRFLGEATLITRDGHTRRAPALTEHLAPRALRYRWLDWLTSMRIGRHGRPSFLK